EDVARRADADLGQLLRRELDELGVFHGPQAVALEAEVLEPEARLGLVGHHVRTPVLEVLDAADAHGGVVNVDPVVGEDARPVDHQRDADEVTVAQAVRGLPHPFRRRRIETVHELANRDAGDEVGASVRLGLAVYRLGHHRGDAATLTTDPPDRPTKKDGVAPGRADLGDPLPHLPRAQARIAKPVDQGRDDVAAAARPPARQQRGPQHDPQVKTLDALRRPVRGQLPGADAPYLFRVRLEEDAEQAPAELVADPVLQGARVL